MLSRSTRTCEEEKIKDEKNNLECISFGLCLSDTKKLGSYHWETCVLLIRKMAHIFYFQAII